MWTPNSSPTDLGRFPNLDPVEVLYEFEGPRIFTVLDRDQELNLAYWSDEEGDCWRYIIVPTSEPILKELKTGQISVWDALNQPRLWICDTNLEGNPTAVYREHFEHIPGDVLPAPSAMLLPTLEPLLTLRAIGPGIEAGIIPGSVIRSCVEGVQKSFKFLSEHVLGQQSQAGRPTEFTRRLFDLPAQRLAYRSFEISFRMPIEEQNLFTASGQKSPETEILDQVGNLLNKGLGWLQTQAGEEGIYSPDNPAEAEVMLRALKELTPSSTGSIERLELRGQLIAPSAKPYVLRRADRQRVNVAIRTRSLEPEIIDFVGRIREWDKDRMSFELREIESEGVSNQRFVFDEDLRDDVNEAFNKDYRVRVAGSSFPVRNVNYALALSSVTDEPSESPRIGTDGQHGA